MFRKPQLTISDLQNHRLDELKEPLKIDYAMMDYLNCFDCNRITIEKDPSGCGDGTCQNPKEGCLKLLEMLKVA